MLIRSVLFACLMCILSPAASSYGSTAIYATAISPDATRIVAALNDGRIIIVDAATGDWLRIIHESNPPISVRFSPDGTKILTATDFSADAKLWDVASGALVRTFPVQTGPVVSIEFSPDGQRILLCARDNNTHLFNASTGSEIDIFLDGFIRLDAVAFAPGGSQFLSMGRTPQQLRQIVIRDAESLEVVRTLPSNEGAVFLCSYSPDGTKLLLGARNGAILIDAVTGAFVKSYPNPQPTLGPKAPDYSYALSAAQFSPDGARVLTTSTNPSAGRVILWDTSAGTIIRSIGSDLRTAGAANFSADGSLIVFAAWKYPYIDAYTSLWNGTGEELIYEVNFSHRRSLGDFDGSGCTDLADFFFVIDRWQQDFQGVAVGLNDFLSLSDQWRAGPDC